MAIETLLEDGEGIGEEIQIYMPSQTLTRETVPPYQ